MLDLHHCQARHFVSKIESLAQANRQLKFVFISISNGAVFANQVMELLPPELAAQTFSIELGPPFWHGLLSSENNLILNNEGADPLTTGEVEIVLASLFEGIRNLLISRVKGENHRLEEVWHIPGHDYIWDEIEPTVLDFLDRRVIQCTTANP